MKLQRIVSVIRLKEGGWAGTIPWYYGMAYFEVNYLEYVLYPVPLNFVMRWARTARYTWDHFRGTAPRWIPYETVEKEGAAGRDAAYELGIQDGYKRGREDGAGAVYTTLDALVDAHEQAARRAVLDD